MTRPGDGSAESLADTARRQVGGAYAERADYLATLPDVAAGSGAAEAEPALAVLLDKALPAATRTELLARLAASLTRRPEYVEALLGVVRDTDDDPAVRAAALDVLGAAAFQVVRFAPYRRAYDDALHDLVADPVPALRAAAVGTLAQEHDPVVQRTLESGLRGEGPLPVPRERAILLLAEDDHLDNLPYLRELYREGDETARTEAVRHMASYPEARTTLEDVLRDRDEAGDVRRQSAAALRYLAPERFEAVAKEIAVDADEDPDVRTECLTTLARLGDTDSVYADAEFVDQVRAVGGDDRAPQVARVARQMLDERPDR